MNSYALILSGILFSALAQVLIKKASDFGMATLNWFLYMGLSGMSYCISFILYAMILKRFPISKISPVMTIGVMILVVVVGLAMGESMERKQLLGLLIGLISIYFMLG